MGSVENCNTIRLRKHTLPSIKTSDMSFTRTTEDENESLSPMARLFHKPECNLHIIAIIGSKTRIDVEHIKSVLPDTLLKHPRFCSSQVKDENDDVMRWVPVKVNLDDHVHAPKLNINNSHLSSDQLIEDYICNLTNISLNQNNPLWDIHILNDITTTKEGANSIAVLRFHHSLGDGTSLMSLLLSFTRKASDPNSIPTIPFPIKKTSLVNDQVSKGIWSLFRLVWNTIVDVIMFLATAWFLSDSKNPLKADKKVALNPKRVVYRSVSMDDIKCVKNATGTTINDVVMGVAEAGLSRYLNRRYGKENKENNGDNLPKGIRFRTVLFFNIRLFSGIHPVDDMMQKGSHARWGNQIGYVLYPFKIMKRANPIQYVHKAKATMDRKKASLESRFAYLITKIFLKYFGLKAASLPSNPTMWFSNMVGPREEMTLFGYPVAFIAPTCYGQPTGLMIHVMTYMNKLTFILSVDDETVPDPHTLCEDLEVSLKLIKDAVMVDEKLSLKKE